jgi:hypothetical protein
MAVADSSERLRLSQRLPSTSTGNSLLRPLDDALVAPGFEQTVEFRCALRAGTVSLLNAATNGLQSAPDGRSSRTRGAEL